MSAHPPDDAHVPFARVAEHFEGFSIGGAVVGSDSLFDAIELCHRGATSSMKIDGARLVTMRSGPRRLSLPKGLPNGRPSRTRRPGGKSETCGVTGIVDTVGRSS